MKKKSMIFLSLFIVAFLILIIIITIFNASKENNNIEYYTNKNGIKMTIDEKNNLLNFYEEEFIENLSQELFDSLKYYASGDYDYVIDDDGVPIIFDKTKTTKEEILKELKKN